MHFQNRFTTADIRQIDRDLPIETARAQQRRIQHVGPVRRRDNDNAFLRIKAVHLDQQRIQRLLAFVVAAAQPMTAAAARPRQFRR